MPNLKLVRKFILAILFISCLSFIASSTNKITYGKNLVSSQSEELFTESEFIEGKVDLESSQIFYLSSVLASMLLAVFILSVSAKRFFTTASIYPSSPNNYICIHLLNLPPPVVL